jgi:hypothetical protein
MKKKRRIWNTIVCMALLLSLVSGLRSVHVEAQKNTSCKTLCSKALKAAGGSSHLKYSSVSAMDFGALSAGDRNRVKEIQYVCDAKEAYSLCIMKTANPKNAGKLLKAMKSYKKSNCKSNYLSDYSATEQKVFRNAICGKKGNYVWYIAMSTDKKDNQKGQKAIVKAL